MTFEIALAFGILLAAFVIFALDRWPIDFVAFGIMVTILALGPWIDVSPEEAIAGFANPATITVMAVLILSAGIQRTGAVNLLARRMTRLAGTSERRQLATVVGVSGSFSGFINNTAAVAIMLPAVIRMARDTARSPSKLLIPLSYASQLGGVVTLIGTSANILASGLVSQAGYDGFSMFSFAPIGLLVLLVGAGYLLLVAPRILPDRQGEQDLSATYDVKSYLSEVLVPEGSTLDGVTLAESRLRQELGILVLEILRGADRVHMIRGDTQLRAGDILIVSASAEGLVRVRDDPRLAIEAEARLAADESLDDDIRLLELVIGPDSDLIGGTLISTNFRNRFGVTVIAMRKEGQIIRERIGRERLHFGDTLLVQGSPTAIDLLRRRRGFIVTEEPRIESFRVRRIPMAVAIVAGVVGLAALGQPILVTAMVGAVLMVVTGCLTVTELHDAIRWDVLFLLAGMIPLGAALENTGGAQLLADLAVDAANYLPALGVLYLFYIVALLMTHLISSNPTIVVLIPVALATATSLGLDPEALALAIMFAASMSFSTPMGDQTNTLVYGPGGYRFSDYVRTGLPLNLLLSVLTPLFIYSIWGL